MRALYGKHFRARYLAIADEIPEGSRVVDVCAGDCYLYLRFLRQKSVEYLGLDLSPRLVEWARRRGVNARVFNLWEDDVPTAEIVVMQASLYQFAPHAEAVLRKLLAAAQKTVIVSDPVRNLSSSDNPLIAGVSRWLTVPTAGGSSCSGQRFDAESLSELFRSFTQFERSFFIPGRREIVGIFRGQAPGR
jgi:SAM-dependent methyltransferase